MAGAAPIRPPALRGDDWVRLRPTLAGVCGTDMALLTGHASAILSPFASFPAVLGHEVVGVVEEDGRRVVVDPVIGCVVRGLEPCRRCAGGQSRFCERADRGRHLAGPADRATARTCPAAGPMRWSVHRSQLHPVPDALADEAAVLVEPFSVALHAVLAEPPAAGEPVLVIGAGTLGLLTVAALRLVAPVPEVVLLARHDRQRALGERLGATVAAAAADAAVEAAEQHAGARRHRSILGQAVLTGGFAQVYDAVGSRESVADALARGRRRRASGAGGRAGGARRAGLDAGLGARAADRGHLRLRSGAVAPGAPHTMDEAIRLLAAHPELPIGELVTHTFPLEEWRQAMRTVLHRGTSGAIKVAFAPVGAPRPLGCVSVPALRRRMLRALNPERCDPRHG